MLHIVDCPTRQQINVNKFSSSNHRDRNLDHRPITNLAAAKFPNIQDNEGLLPLATPMPSVTANKR